MKSFIYIVTILISCLMHSQDKFEYTEIGLTPKYLIESVDSLDQKSIYLKTIKWVNETYKNPDEVIEANIENEFIRITGIQKSVITVGKLLFDIKYTIKISFKNGRYKLEPLTVYFKSTNIKANPGWVQFDLNNGKPFFKDGIAIQKFKSYTIDIPKVLNQINHSLKSYLNKTDDGW